MELNWNADTVRVLRFYKYLLGIIGVWVLDEKNVYSRIRWFISTMVEMSTVVILSLEVIRHCKDHEDTLNAFLICSSSVISISKLLLHRINWKYKLILVESVIYDWTFVRNPYSRDVMLKYESKSRFGSMILFYLGCTSCASFISMLVFANINLPWNSETQIFNKNDEKKLLLAAYCVFGKYTITAYGFIQTLQLLQIFVNTISQCGNDGFFFHLTMHVSGQFEILKTDFAKMGYDMKSFRRSSLNVLLKRHCHLIYLAQQRDRICFSKNFHDNSFAGFQLILSLAMNDIFTVTKHILYIVVLLVQLFLYCFAGQTLQFQSDGLAYAIYESSWYNFDTNMIKDLSFVILRTAASHKLTAGKFMTMNYVSFKEILKASASYLSMLRVMLNT